jgi:hypothetical protein
LFIVGAFAGFLYKFAAFSGDEQLLEAVEAPAAAAYASPSIAALREFRGPGKCFKGPAYILP